MRLHELSVTAFGPFVETVEVDFDELAAGGVFLLTGDTGAGKTSVLDAVCFALYGEVPGDRHHARHLRSDHADPETPPRVVLTVTVGERTFRFTRSPAWERPKRRTTGMTRVQAHVVVEEHGHGGWTMLTNRLDEAGQLVTGLLGMTCTQFTQVAMLPQGRFQAFLRATSAERHAVLQRLFRTRRFEDVERWLVERRLTLGRRSQTCHERTAGVVNRVQEAAGVCTPESWDLHALDGVVDDGTLIAWARGLGDDATERARLLAEAMTEATERLDLARVRCDDGKQVAEARSRGVRAQRSLSELDETADLEQGLVQSLDAHRRASSVLPATMRAENATAAVQEAEAAATVHVGEVTQHLQVDSGALRPDALAEAATRANEARVVAESWLPRERELYDERSRLALLDAQVHQLAQRITAAEDEQVHLSTERERLVPEVAETRSLAALVDSRQLWLDAARVGLAAAQQARVLTARLTEAKGLLDDATQRAFDLREQHLDLRERRISGMAAELATGLAAGCSCPVCGSAEHPSPAVASDGVSRADEDAARERHETADFERQTLSDGVNALHTQLTGTRERSEGQDVAHWERRLSEAQDLLAEGAAAVHRLTALETELAVLLERDTAAATTVASSRAALDLRTQQQAESRQRCQLLAAELDDLLAAHPAAGSVAALVEAHAESVRVLEAACEALTAHQRATDELDAANSAAEAAAASAGFDSLAAALEAVLTGGEASSRTTVLDTRRAARTAALGVLEDPAVASALEQPAPDLEALASAVQVAEEVRDRAHAAHQQAANRLDRLDALLHELETELSAWEPVRRDHALVAGLASLVEGRSADNLLKMRLSAYVLSERLRQVVAAANERLGDMTDQRYALEQADEKGAGEQRGGLSLRVRDEWSGKHRDPATLSGGETFLVSLALALGLADTVSHEAGGTQLDTLFIDEGFGALDATTLDGVMDTLDSLRDGGRVVGLVSHVAELRNRIPAQLEVHKARQGSTVRMSLVAG
jgi:exonuclease SbcC